MGRITGVPAARVIVPSAANPVGAPALIAQLQAPEPTPGRFHQVRSGETLSGVVRAALDAYQMGMGDAGTTRLVYQHCLAAGERWNRRLYGSSWKSPQFPEATFVDGAGLGRAFFPWNDTGLTRLRQGVWPQRGIDNEGGRVRPVGSSYGMLWLPTINGFQFIDRHWLPVCGELEPPRALLDALQSQPGRTR